MANYGDLPAEHSNYDSASIVIIPVPYDQTSTWIKGADKGPDALIEASANMELYDIETDSQVYKKGIFTDKAIIEKSSPEAMVNAVEKRVTKLIKQNKFVIVIGGEHSVSIGSIKAHSQYFKDLTVLQLDAHADTREQYHGSAYNHACVMARARENAKIVQVGIRSIDAEEMNKIDPESMFLAEDIYNSDNWADKVISRLSENVYVTIDLDVFDPSIMPSTGTPEPGGLLWYDILKLLKNVAEKKHIVGFDVVELCPKKDDKAPDFLAAKLIYKFLSYRFGN